MNTFYIMNNRDGTYSITIGDERLSIFGIPIAKEGKYPVMFWRRGIDPCGMEHYIMGYAIDRKTLLQKLNQAGKMGSKIIKLWDYDSILTPNDELNKLFEYTMSERKKSTKRYLPAN